MSDFHQSGPVTALPRLIARPVEELEADIVPWTARFPVALVIPMVPGEMDRPALGGILRELVKVPYLDTLVISLNHATADDYARAHVFFGPLRWAQGDPVERVARRARAPRRVRGGGPLRRRARQGPGLLAGDRLPPGRGACRVHRVPGRRRRKLQPRDAGPARPPVGRPEAELRLRQGLLCPRLGSTPRAASRGCC